MGTVYGSREQFPGRSSGRSGESLLGSRREHHARVSETQQLSNKSSRRIGIFSYALPRKHGLVGILRAGRVQIKPAKAWHRSASPNLYWLAEQLCGALVKMSPCSVKSLRRLAKFRDARDSCRVTAP